MSPMTSDRVALIEGNFGMFSGGGTAFLADVGGFVLGVLVARIAARAFQQSPQPQEVR